YVAYMDSILIVALYAIGNHAKIIHFIYGSIFINYPVIASRFPTTATFGNWTRKIILYLLRILMPSCTMDHDVLYFSHFALELNFVNRFIAPTKPSQRWNI